MRQTMRWAAVALVLMPLLLAEGCICETRGVNKGDVNLIGLDEEWQIGRQLAREIEQQAQPVDDALVEDYVQKMGERIVAVSELDDRPWAFHVVVDSAVNAFNIPGGHVFVNTGLIEAAQNASELAGVLAHEVAHGVARHSTERMTKAYGLNLVARLVVGSDVNLLEQIAAGLLGSGAMAKFSRDDEREADALGLTYMAEAGYRPDGMASMFETMLSLRQRRPNAVERFFSTHPLTEERIEAVKARAEAVPAPDGAPPGDDAFRRVRSRLAGQGR